MNNSKQCPQCGETCTHNDYCENCGYQFQPVGNLVNQVGSGINNIVGAGSSLLSKFMFKEQVWWQNLLLSIVTAGAYKTYIWYREYAEVRTIKTRKQVENKIPFILFLLLYYASATIAGFVFMAMYYKRLTAVVEDIYEEAVNPKNAFLYSLLMYVPIYSFYLNAKNHNKLLQLYNADIKQENRQAKKEMQQSEQAVSGFDNRSFLTTAKRTPEAVKSTAVTAAPAVDERNSTQKSVENVVKVNSDTDKYVPVSLDDISPKEEDIVSVANNFDDLD